MTGCPSHRPAGIRTFLSSRNPDATLFVPTIPIGEKTVLNELMRLSAAFVFARVEMGSQGLRNPVEDVPVKDEPKRRERTLFLFME
jgi:hypothetical protein